MKNGGMSTNCTCSRTKNRWVLFLGEGCCWVDFILRMTMNFIHKFWTGKIFSGKGRFIIETKIIQREGEEAFAVEWTASTPWKKTLQQRWKKNSVTVRRRSHFRFKAKQPPLDAELLLYTCCISITRTTLKPTMTTKVPLVV